MDLEQKLFYALKRYTFEPNVLTEAERLVIEISENHGFRILGEAAQIIYITHCNDSDVMVALCRCLERFDVEEVTPWGHTIIAGLLNNKDDSVKEAVVVLIESWVTTSMLPLLRSVEIKEKWLRSYVDSVISFLEDCE